MLSFSLADARYVRTLTQNEALALNESEHMSLVRDNVMLEDQMIMDELSKRGLTVQKVAWSDPTFDWSTTQYALFRSTWDYADRLEEFDKWLKEVATKTTLINSHRLISWNLDKHYLQDLSNWSSRKGMVFMWWKRISSSRMHPRAH